MNIKQVTSRWNTCKNNVTKDSLVQRSKEILSQVLRLTYECSQQYCLYQSREERKSNRKTDCGGIFLHSQSYISKKVQMYQVTSLATCLLALYSNHLLKRCALVKVFLACVCEPPKYLVSLDGWRGQQNTRNWNYEWLWVALRSFARTSTLNI